MPLVAVVADQREADARSVGRALPLAQPEADRTAVQLVRALVAREFHLAAVQPVAPPGDPVGEAAGGRADVRVGFAVAFERVEAQHDRPGPAVAVRHLEREQAVRAGRAGSRASCSRASANAAGFRGGTTSAVSPARAISRTPGASVVTSGRPQAAASSSALGSPSA